MDTNKEKTLKELYDEYSKLQEDFANNGVATTEEIEKFNKATDELIEQMKKRKRKDKIEGLLDDETP